MTPYLYRVVVDNHEDQTAGVRSTEDAKVQDILFRAGWNDDSLWKEHRWFLILGD